MAGKSGGSTSGASHSRGYVRAYNRPAPPRDTRKYRVSRPAESRSRVSRVTRATRETDFSRAALHHARDSSTRRVFSTLDSSRTKNYLRIMKNDVWPRVAAARDSYDNREESCSREERVSPAVRRAQFRRDFNENAVGRSFGALSRFSARASLKNS